MDRRSVVVVRADDPRYPECAPFHPDRAYPEYALAAVNPQQANHVYAAVRSALRLAGLDAKRFGTPDWNPLGEIVRPGQFVLLKPNLVKESHPRDPEGWKYTITHGSVIRAVADYVWKALAGRGRVMVADGPQADSDFASMIGQLALDEIRQFYRQRDLNLELVDLRNEQWRSEQDVVVERRPLPGDPNGNVAFDLADRSEFVGHTGEGRYYGADYDDGQLNRHHSAGRHEYLLCGSAIRCDVFINLPKLKTHKKAGITVNLKNLVGVNADKNWLPHHTIGTPRNGGDQYPEPTLKRGLEHGAASALRRLALRAPVWGPRVLKRARQLGKTLFGDTARVIRSGNWYGNDTTWRMCLDLNKCVLFGNADGTFRAPTPQGRKAYLSFVDGIIAGQGDGPMDPDPCPAGVIMFGTCPAAIDATAGILMGFDPEQIPIVRQAFQTRGFPLTESNWRDVVCLSNHPPWRRNLAGLRGSQETFAFRPHFGWTGHVEASGNGAPPTGAPAKPRTD